MLPDLLSNESAISTGGVGLSDGSWEREVTRSVLQFRTVQSVEDYVERTCEIVMAAAAQYAPAVPVVEEPVAPVPAREPYVDPALLDNLEEAAKATKGQAHKADRAPVFRPSVKVNGRTDLRSEGDSEEFALPGRS